MIGGLSNYQASIKGLAECEAELKLVIPGNHDVSLDPKWWVENLDEEDDDDPNEPEKAHDMFREAEKQMGVSLLGEGTHSFTLEDGRAFMIYASPFTPEFGGYAFAYGADEDRFNVGENPIPDDADIVVTHGPPAVPIRDYRLDVGRKGEHCGCPKLWQAIQRAKPRLHCFGHIHEGYGAQVVAWDTNQESTAITDAAVSESNSILAPASDVNKTLLLNAAILNHGD